jgi:hypothetical protein
MNRSIVLGLATLAAVAPGPRAAEGASGPKPAQVTIFTHRDGQGGFLATVACTAGSVVLTPVAGGVNVFDGAAQTQSVPLLALHTAVAGVSDVPVTIQAGNIDKTTLKGLATGAQSTIKGKVGKAGVTTWTGVFTNADGSKTSGAWTAAAFGFVSKDSWKTASAKGDPGKFNASWSEDKSKVKATVKQSFTSGTTTCTFSASLEEYAGKATLRVGKLTFGGAATHDVSTGIIEFTTTKPPKSGETATFTYKPKSAEGAVQTVVVSPLQGQPITTTHATPNGQPLPTTSDYRTVGQNMPPSF